MILRSFRFDSISWPRLADQGAERRIYIQALQAADKGDFSELIAFFTKHLDPDLLP
jgi:hypothetical protein